MSWAVWDRSQFSAKNSHLMVTITATIKIATTTISINHLMSVISQGVKIKILKKIFEAILQQFGLRSEFLDLKIVDLDPKFIKIGQEMTILESDPNSQDIRAQISKRSFLGRF